jgi:mono/diheme cytochrome c family protein
VSTFLNPVCLAFFAAIVACSSDGDDETDAVDDRTFEQQVADGGELYGMHCAHCHGDAGQGTDDGPQVVGAGALPLEPPEERMVREAEFRTALDVFTFASENMPGDDPGSLSDQQIVDVLAFALFANGVMLEEPLGFDNAADIVINE